MRMTDRDKQVKGGGELKVNRACVNFMKLASIVLFAWGIACIAVGVSYLGEATIEVDDGDDGKTDFHVDVFFVVYGVFSLVPPTLFYCLKTAGKLKIAVSLFVSGSLVAYFFVGIIGAGHYSQHLGDIPRGIETIGVILYVPMGFSVAALAWLVFASRKRPPDSRNSGSASDSQTGRASTVNDEEIVVGADENQNEVDRSTKDPAYLDQNNFDDSTRSLLVEACGHDSLELARRSLQEETGEPKPIDINEICLHVRPQGLAFSHRLFATPLSSLLADRKQTIPSRCRLRKQKCISLLVGWLWWESKPTKSCEQINKS